jgi:hypothetical protein
VPLNRSSEVFDRAQRHRKQRRIKLSNREMLARLESRLREKGRLSATLINEADTCRTIPTYALRFGSLRNAYKLISYGRGRFQIRRSRCVSQRKDQGCGDRSDQACRTRRRLCSLRRSSVNPHHQRCDYGFHLYRALHPYSRRRADVASQSATIPARGMDHRAPTRPPLPKHHRLSPVAYTGVSQTESRILEPKPSTAVLIEIARVWKNRRHTRPDVITFRQGDVADKHAAYIADRVECTRPQHPWRTVFPCPRRAS